MFRIIAALVLFIAPITIRAADNEDFNPYKTTKVGDYATYKINIKVGGQNLKASTTQSVTAKSDKEVTVKVDATVAGMDLPTQEQTIDLTKPFNPAKANLPPGLDGTIEKLKEGKEKVKVGSKEYETTWTTYKLKTKAADTDVSAEIKVWLSKDVVLGVVKIEMTADIASQKIQMNMEVSETGNKPVDKE